MEIELKPANASPPLNNKYFNQYILILENNNSYMSKKIRYIKKITCKNIMQLLNKLNLSSSMLNNFVIVSSVAELYLAFKCDNSRGGQKQNSFT